MDKRFVKNIKIISNIIAMIFFVIIWIAMYYALPFSDNNNDKTTNNESSINSNDNSTKNNQGIDTNESYKDLIKKVSNTVILNNYKHENMSVHDMKNNTKLNIIMQLANTSTGNDLLVSFKKYFGNDARIELDNIYCMDDTHKNNDSLEEKILYRYDKTTDKFIPNSNHKSHTTNLLIILENSMSNQELDISYSNGVYLYKVKPMFIEGDFYNKKFEKVYTSYSNYLKKKSIGTIDGNKRFELDINGEKRYSVEMAYDYYSKYFDTYVFEFIKMNDNIIFSKYYKKS